ncbi:MAG TPA: hypothetical protein VF503_09180 [Sphingobium sp.]|uniref:hypothetical protein n=1 Tax=Sphingobium sp. TaxID=1912891 RepID=UPI002ED377AA
MTGDKQAVAALAFLGRQQMAATAMQFAVMALNDPRLKDQAVAALRALADSAGIDCEGVEGFGKAYATGLRRYADILETGEEPEDPSRAFSLTVIQGGKID